MTLAAHYVREIRKAALAYSERTGSPPLTVRVNTDLWGLLSADGRISVLCQAHGREAYWLLGLDTLAIAADPALDGTTRLWDFDPKE